MISHSGAEHRFQVHRPGTGVSGVREGLYRPSATDQEADQEENDEDNEADFSDSGRGCCYTAKAENSGDNRNDQKHPGVPEHAVSILQLMR